MTDTTFRFHDTGAAKAAKSWSEWSAPSLDSEQIDSISRTYFFTLSRADSPAEIFSSRSTLGTEITPQGDLQPAVPTSQPWQISIFLMLVLCYYIYVVFRHRSIIINVLRISTSVGKTLSAYESRNTAETQLASRSMALCMLALTTIAISLGVSVNQMHVLATLGVIMAAMAALFIYKYVIISICAKFSDNKTPFSNISRINSHSVTLLAIFYTPVAIATCIDQHDSRFALYILAALWIYYAARLFKLFITNGFGKLQWILYLCTVEILPVSYLIALSVQY